jgi:hypothetical protein
MREIRRGEEGTSPLIWEMREIRRRECCGIFVLEYQNQKSRNTAPVNRGKRY